MILLDGKQGMSHTKRETRDIYVEIERKNFVCPVGRSCQRSNSGYLPTFSRDRIKKSEWESHWEQLN